ncbi:two-component response regulator ORR6-like [Lolium perenne]|uniref:two-component response regulator ORR6-like n=1 Tax=Lolium perenne TaxID=4522 RepID=UPI0021F5523B|nr:two-component response regulator ORR6-like [Lolium perenne]
MSLPAMMARKVASLKADDMKVESVMVANDRAVIAKIHMLGMADRAVIAKILHLSKYRVTTMEYVTRLLELLDLELMTNVNMITTDYWMATMSGYELLRCIKSYKTLFV